MKVEYHRWWSPNLHKDMQLKIYGHYGKSILIFPTSKGRFYEWEDHLMVQSAEPFINAGKIKLIAVDSIDEESWYNWSVSASARNHRHNDFDRYIIDEVLPLIHKHNCGAQPIWTTGCSLGALHALNFFLRHPDAFDGTLCFSGLYSLEHSEFHLSRDELSDVFYNSPLAYISGLKDEWFLEKIRRGKVVLICGQGAWEEDALKHSYLVEQELNKIGCHVWLDIWGKDIDHDWPSWNRQFSHLLGCLFGSS